MTDVRAVLVQRDGRRLIRQTGRGIREMFIPVLLNPSVLQSVLSPSMLGLRKAVFDKKEMRRTVI